MSLQIEKEDKMINLSELIRTIKDNIYQELEPDFFSSLDDNQKKQLENYVEFKTNEMIATNYIVNMLSTGKYNHQIEELKKIIKTKEGLAKVAYHTILSCKDNPGGINDILIVAPQSEN